MNTPDIQLPKGTPSEKFDSLLKQALSVPKSEIDRREVEYQKKRKALRKK